MSDATAFDPTGSSSVTASSMILVALCCIAGASFLMGKGSNDKSQIGFRSGMFIIASGLMLFFGGMYIWFAYD